MSSKSHKKKNGAYKAKIALVAVLGTVLTFTVALLCLILFTDIIFDTDTTRNETESQTDVIFANNNDIQPVKDGKLMALYNGEPLYAGGQAIAENFTVQLMDENGNIQIVTDYTCDQLSDDFRLAEGENTFEFEYMGRKASVDVDAVNIRTLPYPPNYILQYVDKEAAEAKAEKVRNGELSFEEAFERVAFTGDSQIVGIVSYGILSDARIVAKIGESYDWFDKNFDRVIMAASNCDSIIVHYGINTLSVSASERAYRISQYKDLLARLKASLPHLRIIVSGVFPVSYSIFGSQARFMYINEYDYDLVEMCMELGIEYISDNEYMLKNNNVFGDDGLHLTGDFYRYYWMENLIEVMGI